MKGIKNHNQTNRLIKWTVIALDFVALWLLLPVVADFIPDAEEWTDDKHRLFWGICTMSMVLAEYWFYSTIHQRMVGAGDILRRGTLLVATQVVVSYLLLRSVGFLYRIGWQLLFMGLALWTVIMLLRFVEREALKRLRRQDFNTRTVTFVGSDEELQRLHQRILSIPSYGYKFRSMHVNDDADRLQATEDDPRKFPFGNFMRKTSIDELPQFWNVLRGDMSIVGPRPHMLAHTEKYDRLIDKYMVRHFVKPGITGWAQVTGFRGETRELWQMEGRVERDIWYMQHWSLWLDLRIIWLTVKLMFKKDQQAY